MLSTPTADSIRGLRARVEDLEQEFAPLEFETRIQRFYEYFAPHQVLATSSFGTSSALLLYYLHQLAPSQRIYFLDTTFHFPETIAYRDQLIEQLNLRVEVIAPDPTRNQRSRQQRMWEGQADRCCHYNKVLPLRILKAKYRLWISGLMGFQNTHRSDLPIFELKDRMLKFHPFIDMTEGAFRYYFGLHRLPAHPLEAMGYGSIGCTHCTERGTGRDGRWKGQSKDECGLHL